MNIRPKMTRILIVVAICLTIPFGIYGGFLLQAKVSASPTTSSTSAAVTMYMTVAGQSQGKINGSCTAAGHEGQIVVDAIYHKVDSPPAVARVHHPLRILKDIDKSSPQLFQAATNNENLVDIFIYFYRTSGIGTQEHYYTIHLEDARIVNIEQYALTADGYSESVSFTYLKITWIYEIDGIVTTDDWNSAT
jgi:type VI secretion system secreted protein Hcp